MKVLLADPPQLFLDGNGVTRQVQPLGIAYIGATLARHHDVRFLLPDTRPYRGRDPWGALRAAMADEAPDVLGITAVTATYRAAARLAAEAKRVNPEVVTVLGGVHASTLPRDSLRGAPAFDYLVRGEGEETLTELLGALERRGKETGVEPIPGLVARIPSGGAPRLCDPRPPLGDLDRLPFPLRENLVWPDAIHPTFYQALITLRGCPYRCIYCAVPSSYHRKTRYRSADNVVDEIALLRQRHEVPALFFHDSVFSLHRGRTVELCRRMVDRRVVTPFHCQTRTDRVDGELLDLMREAGCEQIFFGIESGDPETLERIRKKVDVPGIARAVHMVKERGMRCTGFFMIGFPWEAEAQIERTAELAVGIDLDAVSLFSATPLPGTELWEMAGGSHMPEAVDFRTPQVNLTRMSAEAYRRVFERVKTRLDAYNHAVMMRRAKALARPSH